MVCIKCDAQNPEGAVFCSSCGEKFEIAQEPSTIPLMNVPSYKNDTYVPKKKKARTIIFLAVVSILILSGIGYGLVYFQRNNGSGTSTVQAFCAALDKQDYQTAWTYLSTDFQNGSYGGSEQSFMDDLGQSHSVSCSVIQGNDSNQSTSSADQRFTVMWNHLQAGVKMIMELHNSNGTWKITDWISADSPSMGQMPTDTPVSPTPTIAVGTITEFPIPIPSNSSNPSSDPAGITAGPDGNLWFAEGYGNNIDKITPDGVITEYPIPTGSSNPRSIALGSDGNLWFTERAGNNIGQITPSGVITEYPIPTSASDPWDIALGPDGNAWFTEGAADSIGRITPSGTITEFPNSAGSSPGGITLGPDGNMWFTDADVGNIGTIGKITSNGVITDYPMSTSNSQPWSIATGSDGNMWFTEALGNNIGRITPNGKITEYPLPNDPGTQSITLGPDKNMWFTANTNSIDRITPSGVITVFPTPTSNIQTIGITSGPDGNIWFTEIEGNIGRIILS